MAAVTAKFGGLDALLNIAGGFRWAKVMDAGADTWERMFAINLKTALNASRAAIPYLLGDRRGTNRQCGRGGGRSRGRGHGRLRR